MRVIFFFIEEWIRVINKVDKQEFPKKNWQFNYRVRVSCCMVSVEETVPVFASSYIAEVLCYNVWLQRKYSEFAETTKVEMKQSNAKQVDHI